MNEPNAPKFPVLKGYVDYGSLLVWCPNCDRWHSHGGGTAKEGWGAGHRAAHCHNFGSALFYDSGYVAKAFNKKELRAIVAFAAKQGIFAHKAEAGVNG